MKKERTPMRTFLIVLILTFNFVPQMSKAQATSQDDFNLVEIRVTGYDLGQGWEYGGGADWPEMLFGTDTVVSRDGWSVRGDTGQRTLIYILRHEPTRAAERDTWDMLSEFFEQQTTNAFYQFNDMREAELGELPLPEGAADARRIDGELFEFQLPVCLGIYAIEPDLMVFAKVEGAVFVPTRGLNSCDRLATFIAGEVARMTS
jgi:hypothetical protein